MLSIKIKIKQNKIIICLSLLLFITGAPAVILTSISGTPEILLFLFEQSAYTEGIADACRPGGDFKYTYNVGNRTFNIIRQPGPCTKAISSNSNRHLKVYYLQSDPKISWPVSDPRKDIGGFIFGGFLLGAFASMWIYFVL